MVLPKVFTKTFKYGRFLSWLFYDILSPHRLIFRFLPDFTKRIERVNKKKLLNSLSKTTIVDRL